MLCPIPLLFPLFCASLFKVLLLKDECIWLEDPPKWCKLVLLEVDPIIFWMLFRLVLLYFKLEFCVMFWLIKWFCWFIWLEGEFKLLMLLILWLLDKFDRFEIEAAVFGWVWWLLLLFKAVWSSEILEFWTVRCDERFERHRFWRKP